MDVHKVKVMGLTYSGGNVHTTGFSGNRRSALDDICRKYSRRERASAMFFINYLDKLTGDVGRVGGGKTAFTCAEPQAIIDALLLGATFDSIRVYNIRCSKSPRKPCRAFCGQYLKPTYQGSDYYKFKSGIRDKLMSLR
ncbi:hypothetical protein ACJJIE_05700 [Microbulbifer sp. TRSA001]|uniref:hypothetical protein n=1 Tax=Microbulbifer sp. TRSA001 TaxID=3243381 RepID=UPI004039A850